MLSWSEWNNKYQIEVAYGQSPMRNKIERREMYKNYVKEKEVLTFGTAPATTTTTDNWYSFAQLPSAVPQSPNYFNGYCDQKQEGINPMNYASASISTPATETQDQRKYLTRRLDEVYQDNRDPLEAEFGLVDDEYPETLKDLKERIAAGKFTFRDEKDVRPYHHWTEMLRWRDPAKKADQEGFTAAVKALKAERQKALDIIKIDEPKAGLEAIKALEAWTPTGAAN